MRQAQIRGGLGLLILCLLTFVGIRALLLYYHKDTTPVLTEAEEKSILEFEKARTADSLRYAAHWDSIHRHWAEEKEARQLLREQRKAAYADSLQKWEAEKSQRIAARSARQAHYDSLRASYPQKLPKGTTVDANSADTTLLQRIPGIGRTYARKIVAYRDALGGFISPKQIEEIDGLPNGISSWFRITSYGGGSVHQINMNQADFKTLVHHPYLSYDQTKAICNLRRKTGSIRSIDDLRGTGLFTETDLQRLKPYFKF